MVAEDASRQGETLRGALQTGATELLLTIATGAELKVFPASPWRQQAAQIDPKPVGRHDDLLRGLTTFIDVNERLKEQGNSLRELIWNNYGRNVFPSGSFRFAGMLDEIAETLLSYILWERFGRPDTEMKIMGNRQENLRRAINTASALRRKRQGLVTITPIEIITRVLDGSLPVLPGQRPA